MHTYSVYSIIRRWATMVLEYHLSNAISSDSMIMVIYAHAILFGWVKIPWNASLAGINIENTKTSPAPLPMSIHNTINLEAPAAYLRGNFAGIKRPGNAMQKWVISLVLEKWLHTWQFSLSISVGLSANRKSLPEPSRTSKFLLLYCRWELFQLPSLAFAGLLFVLLALKSNTKSLRVPFRCHDFKNFMEIGCSVIPRIRGSIKVFRVRDGADHVLVHKAEQSTPAQPRTP